MQHLVANAFAKATVQSGIWLVQQDYRRTRRQGTRQCHTLLLATRQFMRIGISEMLDAGFCKHIKTAPSGSASLFTQAKENIF